MLQWLSMRGRFEVFSQVVIGLLLVGIGLLAQYRYHVVERVRANVADTGSGVTRSTTAYTDPQSVDLTTFWQVWRALETEYIEPEKLDQEVMVDGAIQGMTASLGDPYTMYLPPEDNKRSAEDLAGSFYGVGIELGYREGVLAVVAPLKGTPAGSADVQPGDLILRVKDEQKSLDADSTNWALGEAVDNIRGPKGTPVTLTLFRQDYNDNQPFEVVLERGEIVVNSVELEYVESAGKRVAHLTVSRFGERTNDEWNTAVADILAQKGSLSGIILDMRNNPGGFFDGAITIASDFIPSGVVVSQKGTGGSREYSVDHRSRLDGIPVEVLVNRGSASASEIVAGALRDRVGAQLIGEQTFGKGTVQDRLELANGGGVHITIARWLLPSGEWIHDEGIPVDIAVEQNLETEEDEVLLTAIEVL